ncbi:MAG TPA: hypothetical protein VJN93_09785 [Candidatus Acidoferrum sp.]|nr:hypothetical protein [Candidatus Acidoferrum sp.]
MDIPLTASAHLIVLVVEELDTSRHNIQQILEEAGFLVLPAATAWQAIELADACAAPIHVLITNLHPTGMPGPELASRLRKCSPRISVLYSDAGPLAALEIPDPAEVVSSILPRPFSRSRLLGRIQAMLASHC